MHLERKWFVRSFSDSCITIWQGAALRSAEVLRNKRVHQARVKAQKDAEDADWSEAKFVDAEWQRMHESLDSDISNRNSIDSSNRTSTSLGRSSTSSFDLVDRRALSMSPTSNRSSGEPGVVTEVDHQSQPTATSNCSANAVKAEVDTDEAVSSSNSDSKKNSIMKSVEQAQL